MYEEYVTDMLQMIAENTARAVKDGKYMKKRYGELKKDMFDPHPVETRTAEEIKEHFKEILTRNHA